MTGARWPGRWTVPNLIITPHFTPKAEDFGEDSIKVLLENLARYRRGEPLKNQMQPRDILTKQKLY